MSPHSEFIISHGLKHEDIKIIIIGSIIKVAKAAQVATGYENHK